MVFLCKFATSGLKGQEVRLTQGRGGQGQGVSWKGITGAKRETPVEGCGSDFNSVKLCRLTVIAARTCALSLSEVNDTYGKIALHISEL